ncbi:hypothetical protein WICPIJ_009314 [Wickerhamomyces pijperi]|uniref:Uncharacterized protein n=1 Tax=Wickerhamomyces pijperi TaxID=599730 RepID=A0A9P8TE93_WICPI|nr:hypothetical protein WICPIJ_009314 [Wickerhamomyces pijperi]
MEKEPLVFFINPDKAVNNEDLPEPIGPVMITNSPFLISKLMLWNPWNPLLMLVCVAWEFSSEFVEMELVVLSLFLVFSSSASSSASATSSVDSSPSWNCSHSKEASSTLIEMSFGKFSLL